MAVPDQTPYNIYTANGVTTIFPYEFYLINAGDLTVSLDGEAVSTGFTVTGIGNVNGGEVTFLTPPANDVIVMLERVVAPVRLTEYQDNGDLLADTVNLDFDRLWMAIKQSFVSLGVALLRPVFGGPFNAKGYRIAKLSDPVNDQDAATKKWTQSQDSVLRAKTLRVSDVDIPALPNAAQRANKVPAFDSAGNPTVMVPVSGSAEDVLIEIAKPTGPSLIGDSVFGTSQNYLDRNALKLRYETLADLVSGNSYGGPVDFSKIVGKIVTTDFHNNFMLNTAPGGGAKYVIQTAAGYGAVPDGAVVNSVLAGADHYIGGGSAYVAKYLPNNDGSVDGEALGLYQDQAMADATTVFNKVFIYCGQKNPVRNGDSRVIALPNKIFSYDNQYQGIDNGIYNINIRGAKMPEVLEDLSGLHGGTIIKGRMALQIRRGEFSHFGIDGGTTATGSWPYNWDGFKAFTDTQAYAGSIRLYQVMALGRDFNQTSHAIVLAGYKKSVVRDCQGYNTWYGLSIDALESIVDGFIGGNNYRNVVNAKSHPNSTQQSSNKSMTISNIVGFGTTSEGANVGSAIVAVESDGGQVERVVISNVVGRTAKALLSVTPYNGAVINELVISNMAGGDFDGTAINVAAGSGGGAVYSLFLRDVSISNVKAKAALFANTRYLSVNGFFATKGAAANANFNTDFVEIASTTISPSMQDITLVDNFNTSSFAGALLWNNTDATKARRSHMRCVEIGSGKPATLG